MYSISGSKRARLCPLGHLGKPHSAGTLRFVTLPLQRQAAPVSSLALEIGLVEPRESAETRKSTLCMRFRADVGG